MKQITATHGQKLLYRRVLTTFPISRKNFWSWKRFLDTERKPFTNIELHKNKFWKAKTPSSYNNSKSIRDRDTFMTI